MSNRITPDFIYSLNSNEIFVFGCRNSGRHFDGASAYAMEHFGAVMGQREGIQGQSYAIPTIGGTIGLADIRESVNRFTEYAAANPGLYFLVTPIGCGGGGWSPRKIAPLFSEASKLWNVSLPMAFWKELNKSHIMKYKESIKEQRHIWITKTKYYIEKTFIKLLGITPPMLLYYILSSARVKKYLWYQEFALGDGMATIYPIITGGIPNHEEYIVNHNIKRTYILRDYKGRFKLKDTDIDWHSIKDLPEKVKVIIKRRDTPYHISGILSPGFTNGVAGIVWVVSPDGKTYYLDKWYNGSQTDEKEITIFGFIDNHCRVIVKMRVVQEDNRELILSNLRKQAEENFM